jgi:hypothetical protein
MYQENTGTGQCKSYKSTDSLENLRAKVDLKRKELLDLLELSFNIQNVVLPELIENYDYLFGDLETEIIQISNFLLELKRRYKLLVTISRNGYKINDFTLQFMDRMLEHDSEKSFTARIGNDNVKSEKIYDTLTEPKKAFTFINKKRELTDIYRALVKVLHPDINGYSDNFKRYWEDIQTAYKIKDLNKLEMYYYALCYESSYKTGTSKFEETDLKKQIRDLEIIIITEKDKIEYLKTREPFSIKSKLNDKIWILCRTHALQLKLYKIKRQVRVLSSALRDISGRDVSFFHRYRRA